ncbi:uncharacterized protein BJ212DRAFT_1413332 [Suillus subaureus]|uniref:Uncharacterized protein n=1 Tax=Suillus subaureus TaxID=48587 RepID=A0A9P7AQ90_9AGAM|nr:uncharacterized protein BJ212DRAFT_1413332 [Suillus subaureus]KAG1794254.1 hypothetical protein BJ212DRAFT_1413332 [Suillus subaureus]
MASQSPAVVHVLSGETITPLLTSNDSSSSEFPLFPILRIEELLFAQAHTILVQGRRRRELVQKVAKLQPRLGSI